VLAFAAAAAGTLVVAFSRLYLGYHWLTDVLASMGLALALTGIVILADGLRATVAPQPAPLTPALLLAPAAEVCSGEADPSEQSPVETGASEPDAHRLGEHHRRG
jgi:undecaprenyl-diphosphatase